MKGLKFSENHVWVKRVGDRAKIGITEKLVEKIGRDVSEVSLKVDEGEVEYEDVIAELISADGISVEVLSPVSGRVVEINDKLLDYPETIAEDPYEEGWIAEVELDDAEELDDLMDEGEYKEYIEED